MSQQTPARPNVSMLNRMEEDTRTLAIAANAVNLRLVDLGLTHWGSNEVLAFLAISRAMSNLNSGLERQVDGKSLAPAVTEQEADKRLQSAVDALSAELPPATPIRVVDTDQLQPESQRAAG